MVSRLFAFLCLLGLSTNSYCAENQHITPPHLKSEASASQGFSVGSARLSPNAALSRFIDMADSLLASGSLSRIVVEGSASPEGPRSLNRRLSTRRAEAVKLYISSRSNIPEDMISATGIGENWSGIATLLDGRDDLPVNRIMKIVDKCLDRDEAERRLRNLNCWPVIRDEIFPQLRRSVITLFLSDNTEIELIVEDEATVEPEPVIIPEPEPVIIPEPAPEPEPVIEPVVEEPVIDNTVETVATPVECERDWHISSNAVEWGLMIANATGEWDFDCHWSAAMSLHFSALNYFTSTRKFRTFILRPEVRFWPASGHHGIFIDAHLQMASFNFALSGWEYRIQDVGGKTPALGGGLGIGYRLPVGQSGHWAIEGQLGLGVYRLRYDRFVNRTNGPLVDTRSRTWAGIDNFALSVVYNFNAVTR